MVLVTCKSNREDSNHDITGAVDKASSLSFDKLDCNYLIEFFEGWASLVKTGYIVNGRYTIDKEHAKNDYHDQSITDHAEKFHRVALVICKLPA